MHTTAIALLMLLQTSQAPPPAQSQEKHTTAVPFQPGETPEQYWDRAYSTPSRAPTAPNVFLTQVAQGLKPGRALDIGVGQGRNTIYLAKLGWDVTGFDISEQGLQQTQQAAKAAGVKVTTVKESLEKFEYGNAQWDLIVGIYEGVAFLPAAVKALKPGGLIVVEGYSNHPNAPRGSAFGPNELPKLFMEHGLEIVRYEDVEGEPDWLKLGRVVRMFARKPL